MQTTLLHPQFEIRTIPEVVSPTLCASLIAICESIGFTDAPITTSRGFVMAPEVRNNTRVILDDHARAGELWSLLSPSIPQRCDTQTAIGLNERFRIYRYAPGQRFVWHRDGAFVRSSEENSLLTLMIYLNEDFTGGETQFDVGELLNVRPQTGMALMFHHRVLHQGAPVKTGTKYVLRTDVMYRRASHR